MSALPALPPAAYPFPRRSNLPQKEPVPSPAPEATRLAAIAFVLFAAGGIALNYHYQYLMGDAAARVANAFYVLFSRDPHMEAIGFIWNPLPSLMALPLVAMKALWPALASRALAGVFVSAFTSAIAVWALARLAGRLGVAPVWRTVFAVLFMANPLIFLFGANGMTDGSLVAFTLASLDGAVEFLQQGRLAGVVQAALWLAVAFLARYESVAVAGLMTVALAIGMYLQRKPLRQMEAALILLLLPIVYASFLWMFANWLIMKNALYFLVSNYSNQAQTATGVYMTTLLQGADHHALGALLWGARYMLLFWPVIPAAALSVWLIARRRDPVGILLIAVSVAIPAFEVAFAYLGHSPGQTRYFLSVIPAGFLLWLWGASFLRSDRLRPWVMAGLAALFLAGDAGTIAAARSQTLGNGVSNIVNAVIAGRRLHPYVEADAVAAYVDAHPQLLVVTDTLPGDLILLRAKNPLQYVIPSDRNFQALLANPRGRVSDLLVPEPTGLGSLDAIDAAYPTLWAGGVAWAHLVVSFPGVDHLRLYRVGPTAP